MLLSLNPKKFIPMWFLGEPKNLKISLTMATPGPVEVDFFALQEEEQKRILIDLRKEVLTADISFSDLYKSYEARKTPPVIEVPDEPAAPPAPKKPYVRIDDQLENKAVLLAKQSYPAIRSALQGKDTDIRLIRKVYQKEEAKKKPRKSVLDWLGERLRKFEGEVAIKMANAQEQQKPKMPRDVADMYDIVEEEEEVVTFVIDNSEEPDIIK